MRMVRDLGPIDRLRYLAALGLDPEDVGRIELAEGRATRTGLYVNVETGESRLLTGGESAPDGAWVAQRDIDDLKPATRPNSVDESHGFGEGFGVQGEQVGGDRSYPEEDSGGVRRVPHSGVAEDVDPFVDDASG
jgi:hypothetical protein